LRFADKSIRSLLFLALAGSGLALAGNAAGPELPSAIGSPGISGWVLADLDGDGRVDTATAHSGRQNARGYSQEVRISFGAFQQSTFRFQTSNARIELSSRDLDGDQDRDLVILEPSSKEPIGVWINDGGGSFHEGNLADFESILGQGQSSSNLLSPHDRLGLLAISEDRTQVLTPANSGGAMLRILELLAPWDQLPPQKLSQHHLRARAPPARS
jgi:hypothetical protein